ncbi:MAG: hypothetical protein WCF84_25740 [Anaerolineae bacterium]
MPDSNKGITDSRAFGRQLERELIIGGLVIGTAIGVGLIWLIWGPSAALTALACFALFGGLILVVWLFLVLVTWLGNR